MESRSALFRFVRALLLRLCIVAIVHGHPASGIVVDALGNIFVIDTGHALYEVDSHHTKTVVKRITDGHWLAIDDHGFWATSNPKYFERVKPLGVVPTLIYAGGGAPIAVGRDGALYYGSGVSNGDPMFPGAEELSRLWPDGRQSRVSEQLKGLLQSWDDGIASLAAGPDEAVYAGTWTGVVKIRFDGTAETIKHPVVVPGCDVDFRGS